MAEAVVSPAVRPLDFGYQIPNLTDQMRSASAQTSQAAAPIAEAASNLSRARIEFALQNLNAQKALELAGWQHQSQMQRNEMMYKRFLDQQKLKGTQMLEQIKGKNDADTIKQLNTTIQRYGGQPMVRQSGESDSDYAARLGTAAVGAKAHAVAADTTAALHWNDELEKQKDAATRLQALPAVKAELGAALANPGVNSQADNYVAQNFNKWLSQVRPEQADLIMTALQKQPNKDGEMMVLKNAGILAQYQDFRNGALQDEAYRFLKNAGTPQGKALATINENIKFAQDRYNGVLMTEASGNTGRQVRKSYASDIENGVQDTLLQRKNDAIKAAQTPPPPPAGSGSGTTIPTPNGVTPPPPSLFGPGASVPARFLQDNVATPTVSAPANPNPMSPQWTTLPNGARAFIPMPVSQSDRTNGVILPGGSINPYLRAPVIGPPENAIANGVNPPGGVTNSPATMMPASPFLVPPVLPGPRGVSVSPDNYAPAAPQGSPMDAGGDYGSFLRDQYFMGMGVQ
jgi:hypothetical protein